MRRPTTILLTLLLLAGCDRARRDPAPARTVPPPAAPAAPEAGGLSSRLSRPAARRVVAIGDLHGDLSAARAALRLAGAIDDADRWVGGDLVVVQTGDVLDRGDDDRAVLDLLERLRGEAERAGGALVLLSGNHELMNVAGDFRYITPGGFDAFGGEGPRHDAFRPGGRYAKLLSERPIFYKVGDSVFVHGGILPKHVAYGLDRMQDELRAWMRGERPEPPMIVMVEDGPVWTRVYSDQSIPCDCARLDEVLAALSAKRMIVGHTPQQGGISSACDGKVWRIDVGMARFYGGSVEVLEIRGDEVRPRALRTQKRSN